jgi:hypothetical protein
MRKGRLGDPTGYRQGRFLIGLRRRKTLDLSRWAAAGHGRFFMDLRRMFGFQALQMRLDSFFVEVLCLPFDHFQGVIRAFPQAGSQTIAIKLGHESCLPVYDPESSFSAGGYTYPAAITFFFIDLNDFPFDLHLFLPFFATEGTEVTEKKLKPISKNQKAKGNIKFVL